MAAPDGGADEAGGEREQGRGGARRAAGPTHQQPEAVIARQR